MIFPIAGKGSCTKGGQVNPYLGTRVKGPSVLFPFAGKGSCTKGGQVNPYLWARVKGSILKKIKKNHVRRYPVLQVDPDYK